MGAKIIYGIENIEDFFGAGASVESQSAVADLVRTMKSSYGLPMQTRRDPKTGSRVPSLDLGEFRSWCRENGVDPKKPEEVTGAVLNRNHVIRSIEKMPSVRLVGYAAICKFCQRSLDELTGLKNHVDYPVRREGKEWVADGKELLRFLYGQHYQVPMHEIFRRRVAS